MLLRLDLGSDTPIYGQIAASFRSQIGQGRLGEGDKLPAARGLASSLDINVHTVLKAYSDLEDEGLVEIRRGRGGVVVRGDGGVQAAADVLVRRAKKAGVPSARVLEMVKEAW